MSKPIRVVIIDNHIFVRDGLRAYLSSQDDIVVVGSAATGEDAVDLVMKKNPDIVLMELEFSGMNGIEIINRIKEIRPEAKIVVLTYSDDEYLIHSAFQAGATTLIFKDMKMDQLVEAIRKTDYGEPPIHPRFAFLILERFCSTANNFSEFKIGLSEDEINVLNLIARSYTKKKISNSLSIDMKEVNSMEIGILRKIRDNDPSRLMRGN